ncbi:MAG: hypothetical protein M2R45_02645 [Verrucomicrobia subdivision 3 bacterium]|nr:hypothetical protein [Limisphaerales bacterium]MCS1414022.1 hypothetical protein [Limisphaerales bacterium]
MKSLDRKLVDIRLNPDSRAFIIADAKDADMAFGVRAPGPRYYLSGVGERPARFSPEIWNREEFNYRNLPEFLGIIREIVRQRVIDIMLMSAYVNELLAIKEGLFEHSNITPAARANDATDIWAIRHGCYTKEPSQPFRSTSIDYIQCGQSECDPNQEKMPGADLGLYSMTFVNDLVHDKRSLEAFRVFREEAEQKRFRYFLEVFDPNVPTDIPAEKLGEFINDNIIRSLAGVTEAGRPLFLKIAYHGPRAMEELTQYDPNVVVGILGGSAGTTYDAFRLIHDAQKYGARVALFGRKINNAEHQLAFIEMLRAITDGRIDPLEAVYAYHGILQERNIRPNRSLEEDTQLTDRVMNCDGTAPRRKTVVGVLSKPSGSDLSSETEVASSSRSDASTAWPVNEAGNPDFTSMSPAERRVYDRHRLKRTFG